MPDFINKSSVHQICRLNRKPFERRYLLTFNGVEVHQKVRKLSIPERGAEVKVEVLKNVKNPLIPWIIVPGLPSLVQRYVAVWTILVWFDMDMSGSLELLIQMIWLIKVQFDKQVKAALLVHLPGDEGELYEALQDHNGAIYSLLN